MMYHHYNFHKGTEKFYWSEKNRLYLLLKNLECKTLALILPALIVVELAQIFHSIWRDWFLLKIKSYIEIFDRHPTIAKKRRTIPSRRKVPDIEIARLYQGTLAVSGMSNPLLNHYLSPLLNRYWKLIRNLL